MTNKSNTQTAEQLVEELIKGPNNSKNLKEEDKQMTDRPDRPTKYQEQFVEEVTYIVHDGQITTETKSQKVIRNPEHTTQTDTYTKVREKVRKNI